MPNTPDPAGGTSPAPILNPAKNNAEVAAKVAAQDIAGKSTAPSEFGEATEALDQLAQAAQKTAEAVVTPKPADTPPAPPKPKPADAPAPPPEPPKPTEAEEAVKKRAEALFKDSPNLPTNASPRSAEAFSSIKLRAAQEVSRLEQQLEDLKKKVEEAARPTPERLAQEKEFQDLKNWRAKLDVDFDPKFKEFDKAIEQARGFIYDQLSKSPQFSPEVIEQIKKYGGPDNVDLTKMFAASKDPTLQRIVEAKVADIEMAKYNRKQAVLAAKSNLNEYLEERQRAVTGASEAGVRETAATTQALLNQFDWYKPKDLAKITGEAEKKAAEAHNQWLSEINAEMQEAVKDNSPQMRATLITGTLRLFALQRDHAAALAELEAVKKELTDVRGKWEAVKNSSRSRLAESAAPPSGGPPQPPKTDINARTSDALDAIAKQVMEQRQQAAASAGS